MHRRTATSRHRTQTTTVRVSVPRRIPHYYVDQDVALERVSPSCALLGGLAIGAQVLLLWRHTRQCEISARTNLLASLRITEH